MAPTLRRNLHVIATRSPPCPDPALVHGKLAFPGRPAARLSFWAVVTGWTGAILAAVASWPSAGPLRWGALIVAVGVVTYIPQFFGGQPVRIAHGALLAAECLCLAAGLWRTRSGMARPPGPAPVGAVETASGSVR